MTKYFYCIVALILGATLSSAAQDQYAAFDWEALAKTWILKPSEYQQEAQHKDELIAFKFLSLELTDDQTFSAKLSADKHLEGTFILDKDERTLRLKPVGGRPEVTYSVARVQNNLLIMDRKDGNEQWPMLLALAPALLVSGGSYNSKNVYKNTAHGYSFSVPTAWEPSDIKYFNSSDVLWFWEAKDAVISLDYATFGFNLSEKVLGEKVIAAEKGNFAAQGKVMLGKKSVNWYSFYYEHSRGKRQRIVYVLQNKGRHLLLNVELPDLQYTTQKKYFDGLLKTFKWL